MATTVRAHVVLPGDLLARFDLLRGERGRSEVIAELVNEWVRREHAKEVIERLAGFIKAEDHPHWATDEAIDRWKAELDAAERDPWTDLDANDRSSARAG